MTKASLLFQVISFSSCLLISSFFRRYCLLMLISLLSLEAMVLFSTMADNLIFLFSMTLLFSMVLTRFVSNSSFRSLFVLYFVCTTCMKCLFWLSLFLLLN